MCICGCVYVWRPEGIRSPLELVLQMTMKLYVGPGNRIQVLRKGSLGS